MFTAPNERVQMTRRYPDLPMKVLRRDSEVCKKMVLAWDMQKNPKRLLNIYLSHKDKLSDERYWELMRTVWILTGEVGNQDIFRQLMKSTRKQRHYFSTPEEHKELREMADRFIVYRATNNEHDNGLSWTTSKEYAEQYQTAFLKTKIVSKMVFKKDVFAFINRNGESEIILI